MMGQEWIQFGMAAGFLALLWVLGIRWGRRPSSTYDERRFSVSCLRRRPSSARSSRSPA